LWHADLNKYIFRDDWISEQGITIQPSIVCSPITYRDLIESSGVKMYNIAGWYDQAPTSQLGAWKLWGGKLLIGPWTHQMQQTQFPSSSGDIILVEYLRWFDYTLKGIENWIMHEDPIYYYTMNAPVGEGWRTARRWPLPNQKLAKLFFHEGPTGTVSSVNDGSLSKPASTAYHAKDDYTVDYSVKVFDGAFKENRRLFTGDMTTNTDSKGLTYTTAPLNEDVEVTGHPVVHLWASSTSEDGDFHVFLEEVDGATNKSTMVTNGIMRASSRLLQRDSPWTEMGIPYHRCYEEDAKLLTPGKAVELTFDLYATSYVFRAGNRIRLTITGSNAPTYDGLVESPAPTVSVYRDRGHDSYIELPVIPAAK
jgi:putative CocE/NonD family hydrolase